MRRLAALALVLSLATACAQDVSPAAQAPATGAPSEAASTATAPTTAASIRPTPSPTAAPTPRPAVRYGYPLQFNSESPLWLGSATVGEVVTERLWLTNSGPDSLGRVAIVLEPARRTGFSASTDCSSLPDATECPIDVRYAPLEPMATVQVTLRVSAIGVSGLTHEATVIVKASAVRWVRHDIPVSTTSGGGGLATTVDGSTRHVHAVVSNLEDAWTRPDGNVDDASTYIRTTSDGRRWSQALMIGGINPHIAASGNEVYVAANAYACRDGVGLRRNRDHGRRGAWSGTICLGRGLVAGMAATGKLVYVVAADEETGRLVLHLSRDRGRSWTFVRLGAAADKEGWFSGSVVIAAAGSDALVAWEHKGAGVARTSADGGRHWTAAKTIGTGVVVSASARDGRLAIGGATMGDAAAAPWVALRVGGTWQAAAPAPGASVVIGKGGVLLVVGDGGSWSTSKDAGATWSEPEVAAGDELGMPVLWPTPDRVYALTGAIEEDGYALATLDLSSPR